MLDISCSLVPKLFHVDRGNEPGDEATYPVAGLPRHFGYTSCRGNFIEVKRTRNSTLDKFDSLGCFWTLQNSPGFTFRLFVKQWTTIDSEVDKLLVS